MMESREQRETKGKGVRGEMGVEEGERKDGGRRKGDIRLK